MKLNKVLVGALASFILFSCGNKQSEDTNIVSEYPAMVLKAENATLESIYPVTLKGQEDVEIRPRVDGFIQEIYVDEGSVVKKGQRLFSIDSPVSKQGYESAVAAVKNAESVVNTAKLNIDRIRPLAEKGIVSQVQLSTYENSYQSALAGLAQAQASLASARSTLSWATVTSPVDGVVGTVDYRKGSLVNNANILTTIANTGTVYAYFSLSESGVMKFMEKLEGDTHAEKVKNAPPVTLSLIDGTEYSEKGRLETVSGIVSVSTGSVNLRVEFPNPYGKLRSGSSGKVSIPTIVENAFIIPQKATFTQQDKTLVYKIQGDSAVQTIVSVREMSDGQRYAVTSGLKERETIISDNLATVRNNMKVKAVFR